ncbi:MAG: response regulator transcription factor [Planctomycetes bacterium]|nr:response regulator transcription factor [Planctomycetota bacterium]
MESKPTVFVVDDDSAVRHSLRWLLESAGLLVETFETAQAFLQAYHPERPGCLVLDVRMPGLSGLDLQDQLQAQHITLPIIIITGHGDVPMAIRALKGGAIDFIEKPFSEQLLLDRIHQGIALDAKQRIKHAQHTVIQEKIDRLTPREREVMGFVVDGKANKQIAALLERSQKTIEIHRANFMRKMEVDSLAELVRIVQPHLDHSEDA